MLSIPLPLQVRYLLRIKVRACGTRRCKYEVIFSCNALLRAAPRTADVGCYGPQACQKSLQINPPDIVRSIRLVVLCLTRQKHVLCSKNTAVSWPPLIFRQGPCKAALVRSVSLCILGTCSAGGRCRSPMNYQCMAPGSHQYIAIIAYTSKIPQNDIGDWLGWYISAFDCFSYRLAVGFPK